MMKILNKKSDMNPVIRKPQELSFTILEVIIAVGLLTAVVMQVAGGQGSLFEITDYSKKATEATWLAKRLMSEVEYNYVQYDLKDVEQTIKEADFEGMKEKDPDTDFKYSIDIVEWKLPLIDFLSGGGARSEEEKEKDKDEGKADSAVAGIPGLDGIINQIFEGHMLKTAHVEVSWPEGARRNSVALTYLLTNQKKLDDYVLTKVAVWDGVRKKMDPSGGGGKAPIAPGTGGTGAPGTGAPGTAAPGTPGNGVPTTGGGAGGTTNGAGGNGAGSGGGVPETTVPSN